MPLYERGQVSNELEFWMLFESVESIVHKIVLKVA